MLILELNFHWGCLMRPTIFQLQEMSWICHTKCSQVRILQRRQKNHLGVTIHTERQVQNKLWDLWDKVEVAFNKLSICNLILFPHNARMYFKKLLKTVID